MIERTFHTVEDWRDYFRIVCQVFQKLKSVRRAFAGEIQEIEIETEAGGQCRGYPHQDLAGAVERAHAAVSELHEIMTELKSAKAFWLENAFSYCDIERATAEQICELALEYREREQLEENRQRMLERN
jgi:hypothetical protein